MFEEILNKIFKLKK